MPDEGPGFFTDKHVAIIGLGLMGGSLALALRGQCRLLTGIDPEAGTVKRAVRDGVVDRADTQVSSLLTDVDVIILAAPVNAILDLLNDLPSLCSGECMVLDFGSTKRRICSAMEQLPERFAALGGHPMCGKETGGLKSADARLFKGAPFALIPTNKSNPVIRQMAEELVKLLGSHSIWMDAETHDLQVAATSHLPYLVSNALAYCTPVSAAPLAASGFASTTRLAVTPPSMMMDVLFTNRDAILNSLHQYRLHLAKLENLLSTGNLPELQACLAAGADNRTRIESSGKGKML